MYFSIDVETDGPIPGPNSMLNLGCAAFVEGSEIPVATFDVNLETLPDAEGDPDTMRWWQGQPEAWEAIRFQPKDPQPAMVRFCEWVERTAREGNARPVAVCYPSGFDFLFTYWYLINFAGQSPFSFSAVDVKTFGWAALVSGGHRIGFRDASKRAWPTEWTDKALKHTHRGLDDAIGQGVNFLRMLATQRTGRL